MADKLPFPPRRIAASARRFGEDEPAKVVPVPVSAPARTVKPPPVAPQKSEQRRRGAVKGTLIGVRLQPNLLAKIDAALDGRTRPEAIRRLIEKALPDEQSPKSTRED